jgi:hypothetical protein
MLVIEGSAPALFQFSIRSGSRAVNHSPTDALRQAPLIVYLSDLRQSYNAQMLRR